MPLQLDPRRAMPTEAWPWDARQPPSSLPTGPWIMEQRWHDLLFMHWPIKPEVLRARLPAALAPHLDLFAGQAWLGVVPFWMSHVGLRGLPPWSPFAELNLRTYVNIDGQPGVYFFSLDAESRTAVWGARASFRLPYYYAAMELKQSGEEITYRSQRLGAANSAEFIGKYGPLAEPEFQAAPGSLESFLVERYCLYTANGAKIRRGKIMHRPWPLRRAWCNVESNTIATAAGITLPTSEPVLHYVPTIRVAIWWPQRVTPSISGEPGASATGV